MARFNAIPRAFGRIHPRYLTPDVSTLAMGAVSLVWTLFIINASQNVLGDSISALGLPDRLLLRAHRLRLRDLLPASELTKSFRNFFMAGVVPFVGGLLLTGIFIKAFIDYNKVENTYAGQVPGVRGPGRDRGRAARASAWWCMVIANFVYPQFFKRKPETADPGILEGTVKGEASVMAD